MRILTLLIAMTAPAWAGLVTISETIKNPDGTNFSGTVVIRLSNPGLAQPLYNSSGQSLTGFQRALTIEAGVFLITLEANDAITPTGTSYSAQFRSSNGAQWSETWTVPTSVDPIELNAIRSTTTPSPTVMISPQQISAGGATAGQGLVYSGTSWGPTTILFDPTTTAGDMFYRGASTLGRLPIGSAGQVLGVSAGLPAWLAVPACATCVVTSGSYADPSWLTALAGSKISGNISGSAGSLSTTFTSGRVLLGAGTGVPTTDSLFSYDTSTDILSIGPVQIRGVPGSNTTLIGASAGASNTGIQNTFIGAQAGVSMTTGQENTAIGYLALATSTLGTNNVAVGNLALYLATGDSNVAVGKDAATNTSTGNSNVAIGNAALKENTTGGSNTAIGGSALQLNQTGTKLVAVGFEAGRAMTGTKLVAVGYQSAKATTGAGNVSVGTEALLLNTSSAFNTAIGDSSLASSNGGEENSGLGASTLGSVTTGDRNTAVGSTAGSDVTTGSDNTLIGRGATAGSASASYRTVIGTGAVGTDNNSVTLGRAADTVLIPGALTVTGAITGALTGNASTASALASTVASGRLWIGNGTGAPTSDSVICADTTNHRVGVGTCAPITGVDIVGNAGEGLAIRSTQAGSYSRFSTSNDVSQGLNQYSLGSTYGGTIFGGVTGNNQVVLEASGSSSSFYIGSAGGVPVIFATSRTEAARFAGSTRNFLLAGTTDRNYKFLVNSSGSAGTAALVDTTATTGFTLADFGWDGANTSATYTKVRVRAGQAQPGNNLQEWLSNSGTVIAQVSTTGGFAGGTSTSSFELNALSTSNGNITVSPYSTGSVYLSYASGTGGTVFGSGASGVVAKMTSAGVLQFSSSLDLSLSRASANTLQVGDGGANANGTVSAAVGLFGGASNDGSSKLFVSGGLNVSDGTSTIRSVNSGGQALFGTTGSHPLIFRVANSQVGGFYTTGNFVVGTSDDGVNKVQVTGSAIATTSSATSAPLRAVNTSSSGFIATGSFLASQMTAGQTAYSVFGKAASVANSMAMNYVHVGDASTSNRMSFSLYGYSDVFDIDGTGLVRVYNQYPTTGVTKEVIRAGAGQSATNLTEWQNNAGVAGAYITSSFDAVISGQILASSNLRIGSSGVFYWTNSSVLYAPSNGVVLLSNYLQNDFNRLQFGGTTSSFPSLKRSSAILQARLADDSAFTDIQVSSIITKQTTPAASTDACTAGSLWADATYIYACTASGTIKRATLATF